MPFIGQLRDTRILIRCPAEPRYVREMYIRFVWTDKQRWFPFPCNGCDEYASQHVCGECIAAVTSMFFADPDANVFEPITLNLNDPQSD